MPENNNLLPTATELLDASEVSARSTIEVEYEKFIADTLIDRLNAHIRETHSLVGRVDTRIRENRSIIENATNQEIGQASSGYLEKDIARRDHTNVVMQGWSGYQNNPAPNTTQNAINMQIIGGFIAVLGIAAVAVAFTVLNTSKLGVAGIGVGSIGLAAILLGCTFFKKGHNLQNSNIAPHDFSNAGNGLQN